ncbi:origin recognition complex subunit 4 [Tilletia horrida]|uniref:Origin recognition complex subunit 4 n=1 Tax=Tilletia horrida TaxID=155126 RepID=A0AAN6GRN7_9BASI|nr:origin recognition complex subunit 4 [Tilletia horrida]
MRSTRAKSAQEENGGTSQASESASPSPRKRPKLSTTAKADEGSDAAVHVAEGQASRHASPRVTTHGRGRQAQVEHSSSTNPNPDIPKSILDKWLPRQRSACAHILAGAAPVSPPYKPGSDPNRRRLVGLDEQYALVKSTVTGTILQGMSNSILLLGSTGTGKHALVDAALDFAANEYRGTHLARKDLDHTKNEEDLPYFHVHLDGVTYPTDRICLRALARQLIEQGAFQESDLGDAINDDLATEDPDDPDEDVDREQDDAIEEDVEDDEDDDDDDEDDSESDSGESDNVLGPQVGHSRPRRKPKSDPREEEAANEERVKVQQALFASITSATNTIISLLSTPAVRGKKSTGSGPVLSKPLVISLSNFQAFVHRPSQALLYCLLDAVQASSYAPGLLVAGFSSRLDVVDGMEKRVKSRFSHRIVNVFPVRNFNVPQSKTKADTDATAGEKAKVPTVLDLVEQILVTPVKLGHKDSQKDYEVWRKAWEESVKILLDDQTFRSALGYLWDRSNNAKLLHRCLRPVVAGMDSDETPWLDPTAVARSFAQQWTNATEATIRSLHQLELIMLVAAKHLQARGRESFNFEMCWDEIRRYLAKETEMEGSAATRSAKARAHKSNAKKAFKTLLELELFHPDAPLVHLNMASLAGGLGGLSSARRGNLRLRDELVPVRCQVEMGDVQKMIKEIEKRGDGYTGVNKRMVDWALGSGL